MALSEGPESSFKGYQVLESWTAPALWVDPGIDRLTGSDLMTIHRSPAVHSPQHTELPTVLIDTEKPGDIKSRPVLALLTVSVLVDAPLRKSLIDIHIESSSN
ncbi:hypothetical protein RRG08_034503 [Elysia crispata]|uniref:Uncharacterized protein n=1 Tax=Elysia crispata TaxID=231223 RepID=A0AAE1BA37_9GAST|nr:hypothetical protein RRG08_034503 [Elysia crispata]